VTYAGQDIADLLQPDDAGSPPADPITVRARQDRIRYRYLRATDGRLIVAQEGKQPRPHIKVGY